MSAVAELLGESREIAAIRAQITQLLKRSAAGQRLPSVLIQGETGTGKGLLARALHRQGSRRDGPFVDVNCAAIPETLLEAEMFGFERGAFSDARQAKPGLLEAADRGTIFLDEIGLLAESLQGKLLKAIEERSVRRLGSTRSRTVDVWIISASNEDLVAATRQRRFREDLYHRLAVLTVRLPPLRERGDDIVLLAEHFLATSCADYALPARTLAPDARAALLGHAWPGNVRELANVMERTALLTESSLITARMLALPEASPVTSPTAPDRALRAELGEMERERLLEALEQTRWNLSHAAARLGIPRNTLRYRIQKHGLAAGRPGGQASPASASRPRPTPPAERTGDDIPASPQRLTLLRATIASTSGGSDLQHLGPALDLLVDKVETFGGRVEDAGPDGFVAVFGIDPTEGATSTAAHAALALARAAARATGDDGDHWTLRLAIHAGPIAVVTGGHGPEIAPDARREAWAILAALIRSAEPGGIVVSDAAAALLTRGFELVAFESALRERPAFRLVGRQGAGGGAGRRAAFVGRDRNLELLEGHLASALSGGGSVVGIVGDAGIGKSRLIAEFRRRLRQEPVTYLEGTCVSYGTAIPYLPVLDIVRQHCGIGEMEGAAKIRDKIDRTLAALDVDPASAPYLLHLLGLREGAEALATITPEAIKARTLDALRQMIFNESRRQPIVVVVEDLHWIDPTSQEILASLVDNLPGSPVLFLATYRPGYRPPWLDRSYATQIALPPLSPEDSLAVVQSVLQRDVPETLTRTILDKADGNPFFLEELCRAVDEQTDLGAPVAVPDTIQDVLLARIQRLADGPRKLLQAAAVGGREVSFRLLEAIWDGAEPVDAFLPALTSTEFLYARRGESESVYVFKHALTQEVAYETLAAAPRRLMHAAAGRALERFYDGRLQEAYDRLAHHYARTDETAKAIDYLARFAERSARAYAHGEAVAALTEAAGYVERLPAEARDRATVALALQRCVSLLPLGRIGELLSSLLALGDRVARLGDPAIAGRYYYLLARVYMLADHTRVVDNARRAIAEAERCGDDATVGGAYGVLAVACALSGQAAMGIECGRRAVSVLEKTDDQRSLSYAYWALGLSCSQTGAFADALAAEQRALVIAEAIGDSPMEVSAIWTVGIMQAAMGEWDEGIATCQRAIGRARDVLYRAIATGFLGFAHVEKGDPQPAIAALEQAIPLVQRFGLKAFEGWFTTFLAEAYRLAGELDRAETLAATALAMATTSSFPTGIGWAQQSLGRIAWARGDGDAAAARFTDAVATFTASHSRYEVARTHLDLAGLRWAQADREGAGGDLRQAHALFVTLDIPRYRERLERLAAEWGVPLGAG